MLYTGDRLSDILSTTSSIAVIGKPFTGKTTSTKSLIKIIPEDKWIYYFDWDNKAIPIIVDAQNNHYSHRLKVFRYNRGGVGAIANSESTPRQANTFMEFINDYVALTQKVNPQTGDWKADATEIPGVIVIDSMSSMGDHILEFVLSRLGHDLGAPKTDSRGDYGKQMSKVVETVRALKALPCHTVFIFHEVTIQNEITSLVQVLPAVTGQLRDTITREFTIVVRAITKSAGGGKIEYLWHTKPVGQTACAGSTFLTPEQNALLPEFIPQDFSSLLGKK
jgi:hypothetical protein